MHAASVVAVAFVAFSHFAFFVLQSFLWTKPIGRKTFGRTVEQAAATAQLAVNQGFYNAFLGAGLVWGLSRGDAPPAGLQIEVFFLSCVIVAGLVGGITAKRSILVVQAMPAAVAMALVLASR